MEKGKYGCKKKMSIKPTVQCSYSGPSLGPTWKPNSF